MGNKIGISKGRIIFQFFNYTILIILGLSCFLPMIHVLSLSFSSSAAASSGMVGLWPVQFTTDSYRYVASKAEFWRSTLVSFRRVLIGVPAQMIMTILIAYPLSREASNFKSRNIYTWFFIITMLFGGGLIPTYMVIKSVKLIDSIWALIIPSMVPVYHIILLLNFFRSVPRSIEEAAFIDGAGHVRTLFQIYVPLSKPALATLILFCAVNHWNSWFDGLIYMNKTTNYPLQSYLQTVIIARDMAEITTADMFSLKNISDRTNKAAQVFLAIIPIACVYPFLQKYFTTGIVLGSVKE